MNKSRRKELEEIVLELERLRDRLSDVSEEERDAFDNMPENLQSSERGEQTSENADNLENAWEDLDTLISDLQDVIDANL